MSKWIRCSLALPVSDEETVLATDGVEVYEAYYQEEYNNGPHIWVGPDGQTRLGNMTHWMPMPEPPRG